MAVAKLDVARVGAARELERGYRLRHDSYSVQVVSEADKLFWIRIERGDGECIVVSDLKLSTVSVDSAAGLLGAAIEAAGYGDTRRIKFRDVAPGRSAELAKFRQEAFRVDDVMKAYAEANALRIVDVKRFDARGKVDIEFVLGAAT